MDDDKRTKRLNELAQRIFPGLGVHVSVEESASGILYAMVMTRTRDNIHNTPIKIVHPRCGDALEAALLVLDGKDEPLSKEQAKDMYSAGFEAAKQLYANYVKKE